MAFLPLDDNLWLSRTNLDSTEPGGRGGRIHTIIRRGCNEFLHDLLELCPALDSALSRTVFHLVIPLSQLWEFFSVDDRISEYAHLL